ncbi:hypothetical protein SDC9_190494 [bioreactor metagenome]|uniref:Uncharacterized protein n=1 Tax=bioreactor metagenome TaxID=1076179 RepID=A0A645HWH1_9ZZZZ
MAIAIIVIPINSARFIIPVSELLSTKAKVASFPLGNILEVNSIRELFPSINIF